MKINKSNKPVFLLFFRFLFIKVQTSPFLFIINHLLLSLFIIFIDINGFNYFIWPWFIITNALIMLFVIQVTYIQNQYNQQKYNSSIYLLVANFGLWGLIPFAYLIYSFQLHCILLLAVLVNICLIQPLLLRHVNYLKGLIYSFFACNIIGLILTDHFDFIISTIAFFIFAMLSQLSLYKYIKIILVKTFKAKKKKALSQQIFYSEGFESILQSSTDAIVISDLNLNIINLNDSFLNQFKLNNKVTKKMLLKKSLYNILLSLCKDEQILNSIMNKINQYKRHKMMGELVLKNNLIYSYNIVSYRINQSSLALIWYFKNITIYKELIYQANHDYLTQLPNRRYMRIKLHETVSFARKNNDSVVLFFINIDDFKSINDGFGHDVGDKVIQMIAQRIKKTTLETDFLVRYGGDEFILFFMTDNTRLIKTRLSEIAKVINKPIVIDKHAFNFTVSIGISIFPDDSKDGSELIKHANIALHMCKESGINSTKIFKSNDKNKPKNYIETQNSLKKSIREDQLFLQFQPIINLVTGELMAAEALVRWNHPTKGIIMPDKFIWIAERSGLINDLGLIVLEKAFEQSVLWQNDGLNPFIAVNLSPIQLKHPTLLKSIEFLIEKTGVNPNCIELEITETAMMENFPLVTKVLTKLQDIGFRLAIDDFGIGYSSLNYLHKFNMDKIKIDRQFISAIKNKPSDASLIELIINLGKSLNLIIVAEGIEYQDQLQFLIKHHCNEGQGYLFSPPVNADELKQFLIAQPYKKMVEQVYQKIIN